VTTPPPGGQFAPVAIPAKRRPSGATLAGLAAVAGLGAIALGAWGVATTVSSDSDNGAVQTVTAVEGVQQVISLASKPTTARIPLQGSAGRIILVVGARGYGVLVLDGFKRAPNGKTYQAWVIKPNVEAPTSAAIFSGREVVVPLTTPVPQGAVVAITIEKAGGVPAPTQTPKILAKRAAA
jgi:anti-sigma-K factor RskA